MVHDIVVLVLMVRFTIGEFNTVHTKNIFDFQLVAAHAKNIFDFQLVAAHALPISTSMAPEFMMFSSSV